MFTKRLTIISITCLIIIGLFSVALTVSGPRMRKANYDRDALTQHTGQTIVLRANQPINDVSKEQISIEPKVEFSTTVTGENIIIQLKQRLKYDTKYSIEAKDVTNKKGQNSDFKISLTTPVAEYYYLKRGKTEYGQKQPDAIIDSKNNKIIYESEYIFDFDVIGKNLAIVAGKNKDNSLLILDTDSLEETQIKTPTQGTIDNLHTSSDNRLIGYTLRSSDLNERSRYNDTLFMYDLQATVTTQPKGVSGKPINTGDWKFSPDGSSVVAQTFDSGTIIADTSSSNQPIPLGTSSNLGNFSGDGERLTFSGQDKLMLIDLVNNTKNPITAAERNGIIPFVSLVHLLQNSTGSVRALYLYDANTQYSHTILDTGTDKSRRDLLDIDESKSMLLSLDASTNDQYLTYEIYDVAKPRIDDDYDSGSRPADTATHIVDVESGKELTKLDGINVVWKRL